MQIPYPRTVAITPTRSIAFDFKDVTRVCQTSTLAGLKAMYDSGVSKPFRFLYVSGMGVERDPKKKPIFKPEYSWMRVSRRSSSMAMGLPT
jgi:hypothetical protein